MLIENLKLQPEKEKLTVQTLVDNYLAEESFDGENQYQCDRCEGLQGSSHSVT